MKQQTFTFSFASVPFLLLMTLASVAPARALAQGTTTTIATTGDQAGDTPTGALFNFFSGNPVLNNSGQTAYLGVLQTGSGSVVSTNNFGIWRDQTLIAREGSQAGDTPAGALFSFFSGNPVLNNSGQTAYLGTLQTGLSGVVSTNDAGIWRDKTLVAREGFQAGDTPTGALFNFFSGDPVLNNSGQTAYLGVLRTGSGGVVSSNDVGIWRDQTLVAREGTQAGGTSAGALFGTFGSPVLNDAGQTAYFGLLQTGSGGVVSTNDIGIWRDQTLVARKGDQAPGTPAGALFNSFGSIPVLNDAGQTAYLGGLLIGSGGVDLTNDFGIWRDQTLIAREGSQAPGTPAGVLFSLFTGNPVLNDAGQTAYLGTLQTGSGGVVSTNDRGIWRDQTLIAREGSQAPGTPAGALFSVFNGPVLNDAGQTAYSGFLQTGSGGVDTTNDNGIWITGTSGQSLLVAREGDSLAGRTISSLDFSDDSGGSDGRGRGLNDFSQLAYLAIFTNGDEGVFLFTPEIHWTSTATGSWDSSSNWTIGQLPGDPHDVFIDPTVSLTVTGPTGSATMTNLTIGGNNGIATLDLNGGTINSSTAVVITSTGVLTGDGVITGNVTNNGSAIAENVTITGKLINNNLVTGTGRINTIFSNSVTGAVRVAAGESLHFSGANHSNSGHIEAIGTIATLAEIEFDGAVTNEGTTGMIAAENATLRFNDGLTNDGALAVSFGTSRVFGDIANSATGNIAVAGNSNVTFYDDVANSGTLNIFTGSTAVFFGALTGNGNVGGGDVQALGDLLPGASPGTMDFGGNLAMGGTTTLGIEIEGIAQGSEYDTLDIAGSASLSGTLDILLNGFNPSAGNAFEIISAGSITGTFDTVNLPALPIDLKWFLNYSATGVELVTTYGADFEEDGDVDVFDLDRWEANFGSTSAVHMQGDANRDAAANGFDFLAWQQQFGMGAPPLASSQTVPEPSTAVLSIVLAALGMLTGRRHDPTSIRLLQIRDEIPCFLPQVGIN